VFLDQRGDAFETDRAGPLKVDEPSTSVRRSGCCSTFRRGSRSASPCSRP